VTVDPKIDELLRSEMKKVAPGMRLREALDAIIAGGSGALIVIGDEANVAGLCNGGFSIDIPFTPQRLFELAKMDGAIILDADCERILKANVHLVPDPSLPTSESGMRHRTAERVSRQTRALVVSISQRREIVSLYLAGHRLTLDHVEVALAKANQALQTLERYRTRLDEVLERLTALEFYDLVTVADVTEAIGRFELVQRVAREVARYIVQLGTEGRLIRMQAEELTASVDETYVLLLRDYATDAGLRKVQAIRSRLAEVPADRLFELESVGPVLSASSAMVGPEDHVRARGYRVLARIPMLPTSITHRIIEHFGSLPQILAASAAELDEVDGVGARRARSIINGLSRVRSHVSA
jgi:diadenylate cyclase